ncbi:MAG: hypothetical protein MUE93_04895 [Ignavibacteriaceae bacterium]|jgi:hypothetical protein|nr:hypothetical protein [Ignavibacteriaceae bacterium]MCU0364991.1 hypothetical protein [Ignavibacteriaceae bacterium]MCU0407260.1 hypothetical protein [Ignavibacteriaceae bacterium]MCU0414976.1 hypothetical protein [Ignavibacteriaceae bacterium]
MKKLNYLFLLTMILTFMAMYSSTFAQSEPVMYFCERYDDYDGEIGVSDRFTTGYITVMVKSDSELRLKEVAIQYDKYNERNGKFEYYKKFYFTITRDMKYVFFARNDESDMEFEEPGFYRVFLLDEDDKTVTSALIEIID